MYMYMYMSMDMYMCVVNTHLLRSEKNTCIQTEYTAKSEYKRMQLYSVNTAHTDDRAAQSGPSRPAIVLRSAALLLAFRRCRAEARRFSIA